MTSFDYVFLTIIGLSVLISIMRGFVREVLALAGWIVAFVVAKTYCLELAQALPAAIPGEPLRILAAFLILFLAVLLITSLVAIALSLLFRQVGLNWVDRLMGALFGLARGGIIALVLVLIGGLTSLPQDTRWRNAMFSAPLEAIVMSVLKWFPADIAKHVKYD
ncbi:MAG TPA: CvpA family protein [Methylophilaceae bacterium]|nr:CvpA family protein [Methylophilaceae bacterium]